MKGTVSEEYFLESYARSVRDDTAAALSEGGLSIAAGYPSWDKLVDAIPDVPKDEDILRQAQFAVLNENRSVWNDLIVQTFTQLRNPTPVDAALADIGIRRFWTTNYDGLLNERSRSKACWPILSSTTLIWEEHRTRTETLSSTRCMATSVSPETASSRRTIFSTTNTVGPVS